jgi:hypothetical protein
VAGRVLAFADPEIIRMAKTQFIAVTGDDWYSRRRNDAEGKFFRAMAQQGPRRNSGTKQSVYCLTASGKFLAARPGDVQPQYMRETLRQGLAAWAKLPQAERKPGAIKVGDPGKLDPRFSPKPPAGGLILNVHARILQKDASGKWKKGTCKFIGGDQASRDHLWITAAEWQALVPAEAKKGDRFAMPARITDRLLHFHLVDNTRGEPPMWQREHIRSEKLTWTVEEATAEKIRLRLDGSALLSTDKSADKADRGFDVRLLGYLNYDRRKKAIDRFDVVALGKHWGKGTYTGGARPGHTPLGIAFELAGNAPADRVPPQGIRDIYEYLPRER